MSEGRWMTLPERLAAQADGSVWITPQPGESDGQAMRRQTREDLIAAATALNHLRALLDRVTAFSQQECRDGQEYGDGWNACLAELRALLTGHGTMEPTDKQS